MPGSAASTSARRFALVRESLRAQALDALVVTHLPNIRYLTGFSGTAGVLVVAGALSELIVDFRYATAARAAVAADPDRARDITVRVAPASLDEVLADALTSGRFGRIGVESSWISLARFNRLSSALAAPPPERHELTASAMLVATERIVEQIRAIKDETEIETFREAGRRLALMADEAPACVRPGRTERDVAVDIEALLRGHGFEGPAFPTIVASGPNSALPHARPTARRIQATDGVVLDFGGTYDGYCVDLTRTVHLGPPPPPLQEIADAVRAAQVAAIGAVRPGVKASVVDAAARGTLERAGLGEAFGHGTGHGLGLEVHEEPRIGRYVAGQPDVTLEPGMVFTIEPGAYIEGVGGVRIEDDVLVTGDGCEVLTRAPARRVGGG
jgi:Xaa-Pro aminopeptidase